jgi:putative endonuclease
LNPDPISDQAVVEASPERPGYVYLIATCDGRSPRSYVGWSYDVEARLEAHNTGKGAKATKGRRWALVHAEQHADKRAAMSAEYYLKRDRSRRKRLLAGRVTD